MAGSAHPREVTGEIGGVFEPLAIDPACPHCRADHAPATVDAAYCITLDEQPERRERAARHFHEIGLCRHVVFYRARRHAEHITGCWLSHKAVAVHALGLGQREVLILEDDVLFPQSWDTVARRIEKVRPRLPGGWRALFLGHRPYLAYLAAPGLLRTCSHLTHAYVVSERLLVWLAETPAGDPRIPSSHPAIDAAFRVMADMYALFPMVAWQRITGSAKVRSREMAVQYVNYHLSRPLELLMAGLSPLARHVFPKRRPDNPAYLARTRTSDDARLISDRGAFDAAFYREHYPYVPMDPFRHFMWDGAWEGKRPNPDFDTEAYLRGHPELRRTRENPLAHFLRNGGS